MAPWLANRRCAINDASWVIRRALDWTIVFATSVMIWEGYRANPEHLSRAGLQKPRTEGSHSVEDGRRHVVRCRQERSIYGGIISMFPDAPRGGSCHRSGGNSSNRACRSTVQNCGPWSWPFVVKGRPDPLVCVPICHTHAAVFVVGRVQAMRSEEGEAAG